MLLDGVGKQVAGSGEGLSALFCISRNETIRKKYCKEVLGNSYADVN